MSETGSAALGYRYARPSALAGNELSLATSGGVTEAGPALLAAAAVARAQYHVAAGTIRLLRDPVVTSNADRLRFESFSGCGGVHARLDLPPDALGAAQGRRPTRTPPWSGCSSAGAR